MTQIIRKVAETIAIELGHDEPNITHERLACEATLAMADALKEIGDSMNDDLGVDLGAVSGFLVETALEAIGCQKFMDEISELMGPGGEVYGHRD